MTAHAHGSRSGFFQVPRADWLERGTRGPRRRLSEREAWLDLVSLAAWATHTGRVRRSGAHAMSAAAVDLERGDVVVPVRVLAERWHWSPATAHRFLKRAVAAGELTTYEIALAEPTPAEPLHTRETVKRVVKRVSDRRLVVYRIVNYDTYAGGAMSHGAAHETSGETSGTAVRNNKNKNGEKNGTHVPAPAARRRGRRNVAGTITDQAELFGGTHVTTPKPKRVLTAVQRAAEMWRTHRGAPSYELIGRALKLVTAEVGGDAERALAIFERFAIKGKGGPMALPGTWRQYQTAPQQFTYSAGDALESANDAALRRLERMAAQG